jgi:hypothetical protein
MSRELFVSLDEGEVVAKCLAADVGISAIEGLPAGGTRLVCMSVFGAETMRKKLKADLIVGVVARQVQRPRTPLW